MALIPTSTIQKSMTKPSGGGLFQRIAQNPLQAQLMLMSLGLLGSKKRNQADQYIAGMNQAIGGMAEAQRAAPMEQAQIENLRSQGRYYDAQAVAEGQAGKYWEKGGAGLNAMRVVTEIGAKIAAGEQLTKKEMLDYQTAINHLAKQNVITTVDGRQIIMPPMDTGYLPDLPQPGAPPPAGAGPQTAPMPQASRGPATPRPLTSPEGPTGMTPLPGGGFISEVDPFKETDAASVTKTIETAQKYADMLPFFDAIEQDMELFPTGRVSGIELGARQLGSVIGMGDESTLAAGERLEKNINKLVSQNMEFLKGAMSEGERQFTKEFSIGMNTSIEGNRAYIGFLRAVAERASREGAMKREYYRRNGNSLDGWEQYWKQYILDNPIPIPKIEPTEKGDGEGAVYYDPDTGKWSDEQ